MSTLVTIGFKADTADLKNAKKDMDNLTKSGDGADKSMHNLKNTVGLLGAALAAVGATQFFKSLVNEQEQVQRNMLRTEAVIKATGAAAGFTAEQLREQARALAFATLQSTEGIQRAQTLLLSYSNIAGNIFERTIETAADLATLVGGNLQSSIEGLAKVLDDPIEGINALSRQGIRFSEEQKAMIASLVETNRLAEAQTLILDELAGQFGGIAKKEAEGFAGAVDTLGQSFQEFKLAIAGAAGATDASLTVVNKASEIVQSLTRNTDALTKAVGAGAAVMSLSLLPALYKSSSGFVLATAQSIQYQIALARMAGISATAAVATTALGAAVKVALGPIGLMLAALGTAAVVFSAYSHENEIAARSSAELKTEIDQLSGSIDKLTKAQAELLKVRIAERMEQIETSLAQMSLAAGATSEELASIFGSKFNDSVLESAVATEKLQEEMARLKSQSADIDKLLAGVATSAELSGAATSRLSDEMQKLVDRLDPLGAATREFIKESAMLNKAMKDGIISGEQYTTLMAELEKQFEDTKNKGKDLRTEFQRINDTLSGVDSLLGSDLFAFGDNDTQKLNDDISSLIDRAQVFGGAWSQAGSDIVNAFGSAAAVLNDFGRQMSDISSLQAELTEKRKEYSDTSAEAQKIDAALFSLNQQAFQSNISAVGKLAGVTAKAFKEQSKERQALHRIETAFAAIEIALAAEKAVMNATAAIANQGSGDPYTAFGRIAAMGGIMAAILGAAGIAFGGSSSGSVDVGAMQASQGTGTVLGSDDKSESILNAMEQYNDIGIDQLAELQGIRAAMTGLTAGIAQLAVSLVQSSSFGGAGVDGLGTTKQFSGNIMNAFFGGERLIDKLLGGTLNGLVDSIFGGISKTTKKLLDSGIQFASQSIGDIFAGGFEAMYYNVIETTKRKLWGLSKKTSSNTELSGMEDGILNEFTQIFSFIGTTITEAMAVLGIESENAIENYKLVLGSLSFKDMSGEEIQKELEAIFSQQADLIALYMLPALEKWQKMGEGAFETLTRVAREQAIFNDTLKNLGLSLGDISNLMRVDVAQAIITMMGGLEEFSSATSEYFSKFYSESEQLAALGNSLTEAFAGLGLAMPLTRDEFRALIDSLDLTTEAGQQMFAMLMALVPGIDTYISALEKEEAAREAAAKKLADQRTSLELRLLDATGDTLAALALRRQLEMAAMDESLHGILLQIYAAEDAARAARELAAAQAEAARAAEDAARAFAEAVAEMISAAESAVDDALAAVYRATAAERARINAELDLANQAYELRMGLINAEREALQQELAFRQQMLSDARTAVQSAYAAEIALITAAATDKIALANEVYATESALVNDAAQLRLDALKQERDAISQSINALSSLAERMSDAVAATTVTLDQALTAARRGNFAPAMDYRYSEIGSESYASSYEFERDTQIQRNKLAELAALAETQLTYEEQMLAAIDEQVLATEAARDLQVAELQLTRDATISTAELTRDATIAALERQRDALLGINNTILSVSQATAQYQQAQGYLSQLNYEGQMAMLDAQQRNAELQLASEESYAQQQLDRLQGIEDTSSAMVDAIMGVDNSVMSVEMAVEALKAATLDLAAVRENGDLAMLYRDEAAKHALAASTNAGWADPRAIGNVDALIAAQMANGRTAQYLLDYFESHPDETYRRGAAAGEYAYHTLMQMQREAMAEEALRTAPVESVRHDQNMQKLSALLDEMKKANEERKAEAMAIASTNRQTADILQRIELDGLDVRVES